MSIVMPTYRRPDYLRGALASALAQTYRNTEVLVWDSAGQPEVEALVAACADPRVRYHANPGATALENALSAYRAAQGEFVGTLHDDDLWEPTFLERLVPPLVADPELVLAFSDHWLMNADGVVDVEGTERNTRRWGRAELSRGRHPSFAELALVRRAVPFALTTVFRRGFLDWSADLVPPEVGPAYDLWLCFLFARDGAAAWYEPERLTRYRAHDRSWTATVRSEESEVRCFDSAMSDERLQDLRPALRRVAARQRASMGMSQLSEGLPAQGRRTLVQAVRSGAVPAGLLGLALSSLPPPVAAHVIAAVRRARRATRRGVAAVLRRSPLSVGPHATTPTQDLTSNRSST